MFVYVDCKIRIRVVGKYVSGRVGSQRGIACATSLNRVRIVGDCNRRAVHVDDDTFGIRQQATQSLILSASRRSAAGVVGVLVVKSPVKIHAAVCRSGV